VTPPRRRRGWGVSAREAVGAVREEEEPKERERAERRSFAFPSSYRSRRETASPTKTKARTTRQIRCPSTMAVATPTGWSGRAMARTPTTSSPRMFLSESYSQREVSSSLNASSIAASEPFPWTMSPRTNYTYVDSASYSPESAKCVQAPNMARRPLDDYYSGRGAAPSSSMPLWSPMRFLRKIFYETPVEATMLDTWLLLPRLSPLPSFDLIAFSGQIAERAVKLTRASIRNAGVSALLAARLWLTRRNDDVSGGSAVEIIDYVLIKTFKYTELPGKIWEQQQSPTTTSIPTPEPLSGAPKKRSKATGRAFILLFVILLAAAFWSSNSWESASNVLNWGSMTRAANQFSVLTNWPLLAPISDSCAVVWSALTSAYDAFARTMASWLTWAAEAEYVFAAGAIEWLLSAAQDVFSSVYWLLGELALALWALATFLFAPTWTSSTSVTQTARPPLDSSLLNDLVLNSPVFAAALAKETEDVLMDGLRDEVAARMEQLEKSLAARMRDNVASLVNWTDYDAFLRQSLSVPPPASTSDYTAHKEHQWAYAESHVTIQNLRVLQSRAAKMTDDVTARPSCCHEGQDVYGALEEALVSATDHIAAALNLTLVPVEEGPALEFHARQASEREKLVVVSSLENVNDGLLEDLAANVLPSRLIDMLGIYPNSTWTPPLDDLNAKWLMEEALIRHSSDRLGRFDFALESAGASVVSVRCTELLRFNSGASALTVFGVPVWWWHPAAETARGPRAAIQPGAQPGECFPFRGARGHLVVQLSRPIAPTAFTLEHIPREMSPDGRISSAPKSFAVYGLRNQYDADPVPFGNYTYDGRRGEAIQTFPVKFNAGSTFPMVELEILSNHGHPNYTCLYRFRVHGHPAQ